MKRFYPVLFILVSVFLILFSCSQPNKSNELSGLSADTLQLATEKLQEYIDNSKLAGISALIYKDGEIVYREDLGNASENNPINDQTIFRIFSMTKPITAAALMTLYDEGKFELDDKLSQYLPEYTETQVYNSETKSIEPQQNELTIRHLLTHTSGIPYGWDSKSYVDSLYRVKGGSSTEGTIGEKVKIIAALPLKFQPGTKWEYGLSIDVAGYLVEVLSGKPLDEYMKTVIFDPLGMDDTGFYTPEEKHSRLSVLYSRLSGKLEPARGAMSQAFKNPVTLFAGGSGLVSTMDDYLEFCKMLLNGGELNGTRVLSEEAVHLIMSDQLPEGTTYEKNRGYGLAGGVNLNTGEYGWAGAASTKFWINSQQNMIVIAMAQLMPADYSYADAFKKIVDRAMLN